MRATVVTAAGLDLTVLIETFKSADITEAWVLANDAGDRLLFDPAPNLLICVLDSGDLERDDPSPQGFTNLDVMIRAGQAVGRGLPTLVIAPPPLILSSPIAGMDVAYCPLDNLKALADHVWAFAQSARSDASVDATGSARLVDPEPFRAQLHLLDELYPGLEFQQGVERLVANLLREAGAALPEVDRGIDLAFIASKDSPGVMLMEIKAGKLDVSGLSAAEARLESLVRSNRAKLGVLVYHDLNHKPFLAYMVHDSVLRFSLEDLIDQLGAKRLPDVIATAVAQRGVVVL